MKLCKYSHVGTNNRVRQSKDHRQAADDGPIESQGKTIRSTASGMMKENGLMAPRKQYKMSFI
jgi:hypothetical protein